MKYFVKLFILCLSIFGISISVNGQVQVIKIAHFVPNNSVLQNGKIKVTSSNTTIDLALSISRPAFFDRPVKLEAIVVFAGAFGEYNASDTIKFTNADFIGSTGISEPIEGILATILGNNNNGHLKVKFRYYKDGYPYPDETNGWTSWLYHNQTYQTIDVTPVDETQFIGPSFVCSEETYDVISPGTLLLGNVNNIATITNLGNNKIKVVRNGSAEGIIQLKSTKNNKTFTRNITIGTVTSGTISGGTTLRKGEQLEFSMPINDATSSYVFATPHPYVILTAISANKVKATTASNMPDGYSTNFTITARAVNSCGTATNYAQKTIQLTSDVGPRIE